MRYLPRYISETTNETRQKDVIRSGEKYPDRIPCLVYNPHDPRTPDLQCKYLVPKDMTLACFLNILRRKMQIGYKQSIYILVNNQMPIISQRFSELYREYKFNDGFLHVIYCIENTFGL